MTYHAHHAHQVMIQLMIQPGQVHNVPCTHLAPKTSIMHTRHVDDMLAKARGERARNMHTKLMGGALAKIDTLSQKSYILRFDSGVL